MKYLIAINLFFLLISLPCTAKETRAKINWIKVHHSVSPKTIHYIEETFGLKTQGSGWTKQDGLMVPSYSLSCYRPMEFEQARELYSQVITVLQEEVKRELVEKGVSETEYECIPVEFMLSFVRPLIGGRFPPPSMALVTNGKEGVVYNEYDCGFKEVSREFEWNLVKDVPEEEYEWRKERYLAKKAKKQ